MIAIENARLFEAEQTRTKELKDSLEYQTAMSEVLQVISRSPSELQPVLTSLSRRRSDCARLTAVLCTPAQRPIHALRPIRLLTRVPSAFHAQLPVEVSRGNVSGRALVEGKVIHILDAATDPDYTWKEALEVGGFHSALGVPLMRENVPIGVIALVRQSVRPFSDKQIELFPPSPTRR